jgi:hypothetical protein
VSIGGRKFFEREEKTFWLRETVELYSFEFELEIGVPDYHSDSEKNFLGLNQIYPQ